MTLWLLHAMLTRDKRHADAIGGPKNGFTFP